MRKRARQSYVRLLRSPGAPREVAGGLAVGVFVAMVPVMQTPIALGCVEILRRVSGVRLSRVAAAAGVWLTNPLTAAPLYGAAYVLGLPITRLFWRHPIGGASEAMEALRHLSSAAPAAGQVAFTLVVGGAMLGLPMALVSYWLMHRMVEQYQSRKLDRRARATNLRAQLAA